MLRRHLAFALDPALWAHEELDFTADPWQESLLRSSARRIILCCARQSGKSTIVALKALHRAIYDPGSLILLVSPSLRQSSELFRIVAAFYRQLDSPTGPEQESALRLTLENQSRIVSLPGKEQTVRGFSGVDLLVIDEAARVQSDLYYSIRPMLSVSDGSLIALSTPWGERGWFYEEFVRGSASWHRVSVKAQECARISSEFLEQERKAMPDPWFRQEYQCEFVQTVDTVFNYEHIRNALSADVEPLFEDI